MTIPGFILRNTFRNKRRAALCVLSVAVSLFLFVTLQVALREITQPAEDAGSSLRIAIRNRISLANFLPARQRPVIERIPGVRVVTPLTFFGGKVQNDEMIGFAQFAIDPEKLADIFPEATIDPAHLAAFRQNRTACLVGVDSARRYRWKAGDRLTLVGQIFPVDLELTVAGFYEGTPDDRNLWFHHAYFDEAMGDPGEVGMWWVRAASPEDVPRIIDAANAAFANTSAEVLAETERSFQMSFVSMWGSIKILINAICSVVVFTLLLVSASTMSMAIRERLRELSILKALGFNRREVTGFILAESFGLSAAGLLLGAGGAWLLYSQVPANALTAGIFPNLEVTPRILGRAALIAVGLGLVASLGPAWSVARTSVVDGLKTLD